MFTSQYIMDDSTGKMRLYDIGSGYYEVVWQPVGKPKEYGLMGTAEWLGLTDEEKRRALRRK